MGPAALKSQEGQRVSAQSPAGWRGCVFELATSWQGGDGVKSGGGVIGGGGKDSCQL